MPRRHQARSDARQRRGVAELHPATGVHFAAFDGLYPAMRRADIEAWRVGIARLSRSWAQPLLSALDGGAVARVMIRDERGNRFTATRRGRFRLWRHDGLAARIVAQSGQVR